jgi:hypothetical protein
MPITVEWNDPEKTTFHWKFSGKWTWVEYEASRAKSREMTAERSNEIFYTIADFSSSALLPQNILSQFQKSAQHSSFQLGCAVVVSKSPMVEVFIGVISRVNPKLGRKLKIAHSFEEAQKILTQRKQEDQTHIP